MIRLRESTITHCEVWWTDGAFWTHSWGDDAVHVDIDNCLIIDKRMLPEELYGLLMKHLPELARMHGESRSS